MAPSSGYTTECQYVLATHKWVDFGPVWGSLADTLVPWTLQVILTTGTIDKWVDNSVAYNDVLKDIPALFTPHESEEVAWHPVHPRSM